MSFKQFLRSEVTAGLDETYKVDDSWAKDHLGKAYFDVHLSTIEQHERATPVFREFNRWRKEDTSTRALRYLDLHDLLAPTDFLDSLHVGAAGHRRIAGEVTQALRPIVQKRISGGKSGAL